MTDRTVLVRLRADVSDFVAKSQLAKAAVGDLNNTIDKSNDRTAWLAQGILAAVPAVTALGAGAVPVLSGMATQMMLTVAAAGTMAIAFNGVGDALGALNDYQLDPSAENLEKLNLAMEKIGPSGQALVQYLDSLAPALAQIANTARGEMFPGIIAGLRELMEIAPRVNTIVGEIGAAIGQLATEGGAGLSSDRFSEFFEYLETRARPILIDMGRTLGNFTLGLANMFVEFDPLTTSFSSGLLEMSRSFAAWSESFGSSQGFQEFLDYVREAGPQALDFLGALIMAFVELAEAAAPIGSLMLPVLTTMLNIVGDLANTPLGPLVVGFLALISAWGRLNAIAQVTGSGIMGKAFGGLTRDLKAMPAAAAGASSSLGVLARNAKTAGAATERMVAQNKAATSTLGGFARSVGPVAAQAGLMALAVSDVDNKMGLTNTTSLALAGSLAGPWGAAVGGAAGLMFDIAASTDGFKVNVEELSATLDQQTGAITRNTAAYAANELEKQGVLKAAQDLGLSLADVTQASLGDAAAQERVNAVLERQQVLQSAASAGRGASALASGDMAKAADLVGGAIGTMSGKVKEGQSSLGRMRSATDSTAASLTRAESAAQDFSAAVTRLNNALERRGTVRDYEAAVDDLAKSVRENGRSFDVTTEKGRANQAALDNIAGSAIRLAENMKGAARQRVLTAAIADLRDVGSKFGVPKAETQRLIDLLKKANSTSVNPKITADSSQALSSADAVRASLNSLNGTTATTYINTVRTVTGPQGAAITGQRADGGTIPDSGKGYADRFLYMLADREEVISNRRRQADRYRPVLKAINADMPPMVIKGMLAEGGTAGGKKRKVTAEFESSSILGMQEFLQAQADAANAQYAAAANQANAARSAERAAEANAEAAQEQLDAAEQNHRTADENLKAAEQLRDSLRTSVAGRFSNALTGTGLAGLQQTLARDTNAGASMDATLRALVASGLDTTGARSGLYRELADSEDQETINALLAAGPAMIEQLEADYAARDATNAARAQEVAERAYAPLVAEQQAAVAVATASRDLAQTQVNLMVQEAANAAGRAQLAQTQMSQLADRVSNLAGQVADAINSPVRGGRR